MASFPRHFLTIAVLATCGWSGSSAEVTSDDASTTTVPLVRLLANPELYNGKRVTVTGYYRGGFEESSLYLTRDFSSVGDISSSLWISLPDRSGQKFTNYKRGFVTVTGSFRGSSGARLGHAGGWDCAITDVSQFEA